MGTPTTTHEDNDRLLDLMERWDELYRGGEVATPESLGVDDPALRILLLKRIEKRKRLYAFLKLSRLEPEHNSGAASAVECGGAVGQQDNGPNQCIGRYLVLEKLGEGREGQVFRVVHPAMGTEFVLKLAVARAEVDLAARERLLGEGRLLAGLNHPNLVRVVDIDFHQGRPFVVMDHVRGVNLERYVEQRRPRPRVSARLVAELARAVSYIHQQGIVHQDMKPRNVLIDEDGCPRLIDFGLARHRDAWSGEAPSPTGGTAAYMSPEQALGKVERIGHRTDVFGLGGVLYYLLTGRPVYQSTSKVAALKQAMRGEQVAPRLVAPCVPRGLERICLKALAPDPDRRYQTAGELERALRRYLLRPKVIAAGALVVICVALFWRLGVSFEEGKPRMTPGIGSPFAPLIVGRIDNPPYKSVSPGEVLPLSSSIVGRIDNPPYISTAAGVVSPAAALKIASFEVRHFRGDNPPKALGKIGESSVQVLFDDDVRVYARFSAPAYCYLIALNPDGKVQLCSPGSSTETPASMDELAFPGGNLYFALNDSTGLQTFLLLASRAPLPPFDEWAERLVPHGKLVPADGVGVWGFNGSIIEPLADGRRGSLRSREGAPRLFQELCERIKRLAGIDGARAIAFPVTGRSMARRSR